MPKVTDDQIDHEIHGSFASEKNREQTVTIFVNDLNGMVHADSLLIPYVIINDTCVIDFFRQNEKIIQKAFSL